MTSFIDYSSNKIVNTIINDFIPYKGLQTTTKLSKDEIISDIKNIGYIKIEAADAGLGRRPLVDADAGLGRRPLVGADAGRRPLVDAGLGRRPLVENDAGCLKENDVTIDVTTDVISDYPINNTSMITGQEKNSAHYLTVFLVLNINGKYSHSPELRKLLDSISSEYKTSLYELIIIADELFFTKKSLLDIIKDYQKGKNNEFQIIYNAYPYHNFVMNIPLSESIPVHRIMTQKEIEKNIISEHIKISDLHIIYSNDPPIIWLGGKEGQVVEIQRKSVTSGIAINYRRIEKRI